MMHFSYYNVKYYMQNLYFTTTTTLSSYFTRARCINVRDFTGASSYSIISIHNLVPLPSITLNMNERHKQNI